jgi:arylsulfatase A-like enzyme
METSTSRWSRQSPWWTAALCGLVLVPLLASCGRQETVEERVPLVSGSQVPLVLTEAIDIDLPPSLEPNRLLRGWWPYKKGGTTRLGLLENARLQGVNLAGARRRLVLEGEAAGEGQVEVRFDGGEWQPVPLRRKLSVPVPKDLPPGRFVVDFRVSEGASFGLQKATFSKAVGAGEVRFIDNDIVQKGFSLIEVVQRIGSDGILSGSFRPPRAAEGNQRFSLLLQYEDREEVEVFSWSAASPANDLGLSMPLEGDAQWVRVRLFAEGSGPGARWEDLAITTTTPKTEKHEALPSKLPRVVVLYIMDALRSDHLGHLGGPAGISPTIDSLAAEGATFERCFSIAPNTVPSMKALFTGRVFLDTGGFKLAADIPTLAEQFRDAGFRTGLFSGNGNVSVWRGLTRGFEHVARRVLFASHQQDPGAADYNDNAEKVHEAALGWIESLDPDERVFMHLQTIHPHNPFDPPEPFRSRFASGNESTIDGSTETLAAVARGKRTAGRADKERIRGLYAASVAYNDYHLGLFLERLLERYPREEVLLILTSDHGDELFDHGSLLHGYSLYDEQLRIPLVVWWPGTVEPGRIEQTAVNLDLHASLNKLLGGEDNVQTGGSSLWPALTRESEARKPSDEVVFAAASSVPGGIFMARSDRLKVVYAPRRGSDWGMGQGEGRLRDPEFLFDIERDPQETRNLAGDTRLEADWLRARLLAWIDAGRQLEEGVPLDELDEETRQSLRALGYLQ